VLFMALVAATATFVRTSLADDGSPAPASAPSPAPVFRGAWPASVVELARSLPIQEAGRVMPLSQWARYTLLGLNHRASVVDAQGRTLEPVEWALDVMFRPEEAAKQEVFLVDTSEVLDAVGYRAADGKKKRDRYSYLDLAPFQRALAQKADLYEGVADPNTRVDPKTRSPAEGGIVALSNNIRRWVGLADLFEGARFEAPMSSIPALREIFGAATVVRASDVFPRLEALRGAGQDEKDPRARDTITLLQGMSDAFTVGRLLALVPPEGTKAEEEAWYSPRKLFERAFERGGLEPGHLAALRDLEAAARAAASDDVAGFTRAFQDFHGRTTARAAARGEGEKIRLEVFLLRLEPFLWARILYLVAFLLVALSWLWRRRFLGYAIWGLLLAGLSIHVTGIVLRCVLHARPPVTTLYETTLFISAFGVAGFAALERIHRRGFGLALAPFFGVLGLFISNRYETISADDPMPQLVAVLDTNFWLATHVTCVTIGYSATLIASGIAHVAVIASLFGWKKDDADFHRSVTKATYGTLAFALVFSTVGTILGGIWANESWGRFWGWDPKENGALLIVLAQLAVLHGRMGGMLKAQGVALGTIACGAVVAFSWWGVNLLGVGLHAYGFTAGLWTGLLVFWGIEAVVLAAGIFVKRPA
jgi:ABC-type transport system involved in cytochrome c biogenesis permease subunit